MTVCAFQLSHPTSESVKKIDRLRLMNECKAVHPSFHEWPRWINATLTRIMLNERYNNEKNVRDCLKQSILIQNQMIARRSMRSSAMVVNPRNSLPN